MNTHVHNEASIIKKTTVLKSSVRCIQNLLIFLLLSNTSAAEVKYRLKAASWLEVDPFFIWNNKPEQEHMHQQ